MINGKYTYDSTTFDENFLSSAIGDYSYTTTPYGITLSVNGFTFGSNPNNVDFKMQIQNNLIAWDGYIINNNDNVFDKGTPRSVIWSLRDLTATALSSDALPLTAPDLANWTTNNLTIRADEFSITAKVIQAEVIPPTTVPEPSTTLLLGIALAGILAYGSWWKYAA